MSNVDAGRVPHHASFSSVYSQTDSKFSSSWRPSSSRRAIIKLRISNTHPPCLRSIVGIVARLEVCLASIRKLVGLNPAAHWPQQMSSSPTVCPFVTQTVRCNWMMHHPVTVSAQIYTRWLNRGMPGGLLGLNRVPTSLLYNKFSHCVGQLLSLPWETM